MPRIGFFGVLLLSAAVVTTACLGIVGVPPFHVAKRIINQNVTASSYGEVSILTISPNWFGIFPPLILASLGMILLVIWFCKSFGPKKGHQSSPTS
jgi:hypothetical protein